MAYLNCLNINTYYEEYGAKGRTVILLHGWGQNTEMMAFIGEHLKTNFHVYNFDFPGFGQSDEPLSSFSCEDYMEFLREFIIINKIEEPILIGHSFGCRIAIRYAYKYPVYKMVLTGAAGIKDQRTLMWYLKTYSYKMAKKILSLSFLKKYQEKLAKKVGSEDYRNTSGIMRETFVKVVNDDITDLLGAINVETLLVFGENDEATPLKKGKMMEELMPNAALVVFENDDHYAYINEAGRFLRVLDAFFRSDINE